MKKILVIEDNQSILAIIIDILEANFLVIVAKNGREGIEKAQQELPDLIICDVIMPEVDVYEVL